MQAQVLALDCGFQPVGVYTWEQAISWIVKRVAIVVEEYPDKLIRSVNWTVKVPSVVQFIRPVRKRSAIKFSRINVWLRDRRRCQYCGRHQERHEFTYDHVIPRARGGKTCWENVVVSCVPCNQRKANRSPEQVGMRLLSRPVKPKSLPDDARRHHVEWRPGHPESWQGYLRSSAYWNAPLESDD